MAKIGLPKGSGKRLKVREKSVKSQGILKWILSGNPENINTFYANDIYFSCTTKARLTILAKRPKFARMNRDMIPNLCHGPCVI